MDKKKMKWPKIEVYSGENDAITLGPAEIWDMIFNDLGVEDQYNGSRVCKLIAGVLKEKLPSALFRMSLPVFIWYLDYEDLMNVVEASQSVSSVVDTCLQPILDKADNKNSFAYSIASRIFNLYSNWGPWVNPVMTYKSIFLRYDATVELPHEYQRYVSNTKQFVGKHGKRIRWLDIAYTSEEDHLIEYEHILRFVLMHTPNIQRLTITLDTKPQPEPQQMNLDLPDLLHLETVELCTNDKQAIDTIVHKYGPQLVNLSIADTVDIRNPRDNLDHHWHVAEGVVLSQLKKLSLRIISMTYAEHFARLVESQPFQLKKLEIEFGTYNEDYVRRTVAMINQFQSGLEEITVSKCMEYNCEHTSTNIANTHFQDLRLPSAKRLELNWVGFPSGMLLNTISPALEKLALETMMERSTMNNNMDSKMCKRLYEQPTFWETSPPTLKSVNVCVQYTAIGCTTDEWHEESYLYNRDMFNHLQKTKLSSGAANEN